jgi:UDP-N-acetylmuramoyl-tripeptide--D-alanyl-D-alanine ligase
MSTAHVEHQIWNGFGLINGLNARLHGVLPQPVTGVSIDTRTLQPGDLFVALRGENNDGHGYVRTAFAKGAAAAVVEEQAATELRDCGPLLIVTDSLKAMESLGRKARLRSKADILAVTGSVGKTGTKEMLRKVLSRFGQTHASAASYNNHFGVPLTLARMAETAQFGVFEIGMNHAGEITPLVGMVRPHVAVITTVAAVHIENFPDVEAIADAKAEIFLGLEPDGAAIVNRDNPYYDRLSMRAADAGVQHILTFGTAPHADARLISFSQSDHGAQMEADICGTHVRCALGMPGQHHAMNALSVLLSCYALGLDVRAAAEELRFVHAPDGRGAQTILATRAGTFTLIDESYNANPTSMRAALEVLGATRPIGIGRHIAVLGDMLELGPQAEDMHKELIDVLAVSTVDLVFCAGPMMKALFDILPRVKRGGWAPTATELKVQLMDAIHAGDVVMVKGSNGSRMGLVVAGLKEHFPAARGSSEVAQSC